MNSKLPTVTENIHWQGEGPALLLLHGWGMNGAVFQTLSPLLVNAGFRVGVAQLPGFGGSPAISPSDDIEQLAAHLWHQLPVQCHLLGWSLGGLVAMQMALKQPQRALSLCTIATSPCFQAQPEWPGIDPNVLQRFGQQLTQDIDKTINGFFALQGMGSDSARADVRQLKQAVLCLPQAEIESLLGGLKMLQCVDLRSQLGQLHLPWLRIYGNNDALVPRASIELMSELAATSQRAIINHAGHAPFVSHLELTCSEIYKFYVG